MSKVILHNIISTVQFLTYRPTSQLDWLVETNNQKAVILLILFHLLKYEWLFILIKQRISKGKNFCSSLTNRQAYYGCHVYCVSNKTAGQKMRNEFLKTIKCKIKNANALCNRLIELMWMTVIRAEIGLTRTNCSNLKSEKWLFESINSLYCWIWHFVLCCLDSTEVALIKYILLN